MVRNVLPERTRRRIGILSVVAAFALPACGAASAGTTEGSDTPVRSSFGDDGTIGCVDSAASVRRAATAPGDGRTIASVPSSGAALRKVATPVQTSAVASVPALGPGRQVAVREMAKTAFGGMRATGVASVAAAGPCG